MNTIRQLQIGEPAVARRILDASAQQSTGAQVTEASVEDAAMFGGSGSGKDAVVNAGDLLAEDIRESGCPAGVRAAIVARKPGNAGGAKGGRKKNASKEGPGEETLPVSFPKGINKEERNRGPATELKRGV